MRNLPRAGGRGPRRRLGAPRHATFRTASIHCRPAPPRQTEALSSRTSRSRPWKRRSQAVRERKTSVLRACRVPNPAKRLNVVRRPKTLFEHAHAEGVIGPSQWEPHLYERPSIGPSSDWFCSEFWRVFQRNPGYVAAQSYTMGIIIGKCIRRAGSLEDRE